MAVMSVAGCFGLLLPDQLMIMQAGTVAIHLQGRGDNLSPSRIVRSRGNITELNALIFDKIRVRNHIPQTALTTNIGNGHIADADNFTDAGIK